MAKKNYDKERAEFFEDNILDEKDGLCFYRDGGINSELSPKKKVYIPMEDGMVLYEMGFYLNRDDFGNWHTTTLGEALDDAAMDGWYLIGEMSLRIPGSD